MGDATPSVKIPARPTLYRGVQMRSRLEAHYAQWLDSIHADWHYEPDCFADESGQYLPDFRIDGVTILGSPRTLYVELKPTVAFEDLPWIFARMRIIRSTAPDAWLGLESERGLRDGCVGIDPPADLNCDPMSMVWIRTEAGPGLAIPWARTWNHY